MIAQVPVAQGDDETTTFGMFYQAEISVKVAVFPCFADVRIRKLSSRFFHDDPLLVIKT